VAKIIKSFPVESDLASKRQQFNVKQYNGVKFRLCQEFCATLQIKILSSYFEICLAFMLGNADFFRTPKAGDK